MDEVKTYAAALTVGPNEIKIFVSPFMSAARHMMFSFEGELTDTPTKVSEIEYEPVAAFAVPIQRNIEQIREQYGEAAAKLILFYRDTNLIDAVFVELPSDEARAILNTAYTDDPATQELLDRYGEMIAGANRRIKKRIVSESEDIGPHLGNLPGMDGPPSDN